MINEKQIKIVFLGSATFSVPILMELIKRYTVVSVVTEIDKPGGRGLEIVSPPTKALSQQQGIPVYQPLSLQKNPKLLEKLAGLNPDLCVVAAYGKILPSEYLNFTRHGCLNVHPSLLPGASPIQSAFLNSDIETGCSIILMDEGMDTGDILVQKSVQIDPDWGYRKLEQKLSLLGAQLLAKRIPDYIKGNLSFDIQDDHKASFCYKVSKEDGLINWAHSAKKIIGKVKAFEVWPGSYTYFGNKKLDIINAQIAEIPNEKVDLGKVMKQNGKIFVRTGSGFIELFEVRPEGKNKMSVKDFINGHQDFVGSVLG